MFEHFFETDDGDIDRILYNFKTMKLMAFGEFCVINALILSAFMQSRQMRRLASEREREASNAANETEKLIRRDIDYAAKLTEWEAQRAKSQSELTTARRTVESLQNTINEFRHIAASPAPALEPESPQKKRKYDTTTASDTFEMRD